MKPGFKTTEFWVAVLTGVGSIAGAFAGALDGKTAAILATVSGVAYQLVRAWTKSSEAQAAGAEAAATAQAQGSAALDAALPKIVSQVKDGVADRVVLMLSNLLKK